MKKQLNYLTTLLLGVIVFLILLGMFLVGFFLCVGAFHSDRPSTLVHIPIGFMNFGDFCLGIMVMGTTLSWFKKLREVSR